MIVFYILSQGIPTISPIKESKVFDEHIVSITPAIFQKNEKPEDATVKDDAKRPI